MGGAGWLLNDGWRPGLNCDVSHTERWHGTVCAGSTILRLELIANGLEGTIPTELGQLPDLRVLVIESDPRLSGTLPTELGGLRKLRSFSVQNNTRLSGTLPTEMSDMPDLTFLTAASTSLSGSIPSAAVLQRLKYLDLASNALTGYIPAAPSALERIEFLSLHNNKLSGTLPTTIGNLTKLVDRFYGHGNRISGVLPSQLGMLSNVPLSSLYENSLSGTLPTELGSLHWLQFPALSYNRMSGTTPSELSQGDWASLQGRLDLASNFLDDKDEQALIDAAIAHRPQVRPARLVTAYSHGPVTAYERSLLTTAERATSPWYAKVQTGACQWRAQPNGRFQCSRSSTETLA